MIILERMKNDRDIEKQISEINLLKCQKPARYIPAEINPVKKDFKKSKVRVALAFPDTYEIGMSNTGFNN